MSEGTFKPDPKQGKRRTAKAKEWMEIRGVKLDACRVCGASRGLSLHHVVPRSLGGDDTADNLVPLCGTGTTGCHGRVEAHDKAARLKMLDSLTVREQDYATTRKGLYWLDHYYGS